MIPVSEKQRRQFIRGYIATLPQTEKEVEDEAIAVLMTASRRDDVLVALRFMSHLAERGGGSPKTFDTAMSTWLEMYRMTTLRRK